MYALIRVPVETLPNAVYSDIIPFVPANLVSPVTHIEVALNPDAHLIRNVLTKMPVIMVPALVHVYLKHHVQSMPSAMANNTEPIAVVLFVVQATHLANVCQ